MNRFVGLTFMWLACLTFSWVAAGMASDVPAFDDASLEFFEKEVRPILVSRCFECHSTDHGSPRGNLALDSREGLLTGGDTGPAVMLEKTAESLLLSSINYGDIYQMPPKSKLPDNEIAILTRWVEMGLPWPKETAARTGAVKPFNLAERRNAHWCWQSLNLVELPLIRQADWPLSDVDQFILAKLETQGLEPSPPADRRALIRRVYFDLIGLPPSPDDVEQFVQDQRPQAFEIVVDRLLGSQHFGERWGRHWLDLARYAETRGHEFEPLIPNAWQYRDYVIRAINQDVPYDRFVIEQLAGDLIEPRWRNQPHSQIAASLPVNEAKLGTGFWFLGEEVHSPVDIRKDETDRMDNRIDVLSKTFLGLTVACARCHDHKFDAISQKDYYALVGYALGGSYRQYRVDTAEQHRRIAAKLDELRTQRRQAAARAILTSAQPVLDHLDRYWLAAIQGLESGYSATDGEEAINNPAAAAGFEIVKRMADENQLDPILLARWCRELAVAKGDAGHPLKWLGANEAAVQSTAIGASSEVVDGSLNSDPQGSLPGLVVDFGNPGQEILAQDGVSFGLSPQPRGRLIVPDAPTAGYAIDTIGGWKRDLFWQRITLTPGTEVDSGTLGAWQQYGRMVRTPEFHLSGRHLWYLIRGSVRAYAAINSHLIVVGPLHGGVLREYKHEDDQWHWVSHDLALYPGHRMHIEFSPGDDGPAQIAMVVQSEEMPTLPSPKSIQDEIRIAAGKPLPERVATYAAIFRNAAESILERPLDAWPGNTGPASLPGRYSARAELANWIVSHPLLFSAQGFSVPASDLKATEEELARTVRWDSTLAPVMLEGNGVDELLLVRGNSSNPKDPVPRRFLEAFQDGETPRAAPRGQESGRLELAQEIVRSPLAARVAVNRIWHHLFGRGIVPSVDNLGVLGIAPSHPELLDTLAARFIRDGWSTKSMIKSLVLSRTYQMSSHPTAGDKSDPDNTFWHRMPMKRLEGEIIRDALLAVSGRMDPAMYGPSVPIHLTEFMQGRGRPGASGPLDGNGRRSIYISVRRNFLSPMMLAFDTPSPFSTVGRRMVSNVPAQALILMNDPFVIEQAGLWADRTLADPSRTRIERLNDLYLTAFARLPTAAETEDSSQFLDSLGEGESEQRRSAWSNLCHVLLNVKEFVYIE